MKSFLIAPLLMSCLFHIALASPPPPPPPPTGPGAPEATMDEQIDCAALAAKISSQEAAMRATPGPKRICDSSPWVGDSSADLARCYHETSAAFAQKNAEIAAMKAAFVDAACKANDPAPETKPQVIYSRRCVPGPHGREDCD